MKPPIIGKIRGDVKNGDGTAELSKEFSELMKSDPLTFCDVLSDAIWELQCLYQMATEELLLAYKKQRQHEHH
jgi:hypothetical protein